MNNRSYQKELEQILARIDASTSVPALFLHSCCAPCSSYVLEYLRSHFRITVFYYNPNISSREEYRKRVGEQKRLIAVYNEELAAGEVKGYPIAVIEGDYEPDAFYRIAKGLEECPEGKERCFACYELRLRETARRASEGKFDFFTTTLTISPLKNAKELNRIGEMLAGEYEVRWLPSDFKKRGGYQRSVLLSSEYNLYRQDFCGCIYSKKAKERQKKADID